MMGYVARKKLEYSGLWLFTSRSSRSIAVIALLTWYPLDKVTLASCTCESFLRSEVRLWTSFWHFSSLK